MAKRAFSVTPLPLLHSTIRLIRSTHFTTLAQIEQSIGGVCGCRFSSTPVLRQWCPGPYPSTSVGEVCLASVACIDHTIAGKSLPMFAPPDPLLVTDVYIGLNKNLSVHSVEFLFHFYVIFVMWSRL